MEPDGIHFIILHDVDVVFVSCPIRGHGSSRLQRLIIRRSIVDTSSDLSLPAH